jgi:Na+-driven multidrug efflux pump
LWDFVSATFLQPCKTCGFAYPGCKTVIYLERYVPLEIYLIKGLDKYIKHCFNYVNEGKNMKIFIKSLKVINYRLYLSIVLMMLFPTVYKTVRIYFLGAMPDDWGINIASQLAWADLFYEVIQEALILPLFFILGKSLSNKHELENKIRSGLLLTGIIYSGLSLVLIVFAREFVLIMAQNIDLLDATVNYIRLETIAALLQTLFRFMFVVLILIKKDVYLYITLAIQMAFSILLDTFLISDLSISLNMGVNGIAISNIIVNFSNLLICFFLLSREQIYIFKKNKMSFSWVKEWFKVGKYSGIESLIRNFVFIVMIIRMVNLVSEQGSYWLANNFIWHWLLLPALALHDLIQRDIGENKNNIQKNTLGYITLTTIFAVFWLLSIPLWKPFLKNIMNVNNFETVFYIATLQTVFYLTFIFNRICDSTFYGVGRTDYMLIQSICIDVFYYGIAFILYLNNIFIPTLFSISMLFGIGMTLDFIPTAILYFRMLKKMNMKILPQK